jgi:predicted 2-oxoglutarate/Fe(II)-dependent dioxygenase YbiX
MTEKAPLRVGDLLPVVRLADADGTTVDLSHQSVAGHTLLLLLNRGAGAHPARSELERQLEHLAEMEVLPFVISDAHPAGSDDSLATLIDPQGALESRFGVHQTAFVVVDPRGRIRAIDGPDQMDEVLSLVAAIHAESESSVLRRTAPALIVPEVLERALIDELIAYWQAGEKTRDLTASGTGTLQSQVEVKKRSDVTITDKALFQKMRDRLIGRVLPEMRRAFSFTTASFEAFRIGCYDAKSGGFFRRHRDNRSPSTAHRSFAMSLNLNTGEYEGGQLRFPEFGRELYESGPGGAIVFSCNLLHEALPVTRGRRFAVFTFFADAAGLAREEEIRERLAKQGHKSVDIR